MNSYLNSAIQEFKKYKLLGEKTLHQLNEEEIFWQANPESNSIAIIVKHLHGNMLSRWTDPLTTDGEKEWRERDEEFQNKHSTKDEVMSLWEQGWACLFDSLESFKNIDLETIIYIRNEAHTLYQAINRQLTHYPSHVGQMMYIGKMIKGSEWQSLSIPLNGSKQFKAALFSKPKNN